MMENINKLKAVVAAAFGVLTALWGWFGWLIVALVACMILDWITGSAASRKEGTWASGKGRAGIWHKAATLVVVIVAGILDLVIGMLLGQAPGLLPWEYSVLFCPMVVAWYILTETGSIIENAGRLGAPVPKWLAKGIAAFRDKVDATGSKIVPDSDGGTTDKTSP